MPAAEMPLRQRSRLCRPDVAAQHERPAAGDDAFAEAWRAGAGEAVWVLDRPNPAGRPVEGLTLRSGWESFVGAGPMAAGSVFFLNLRINQV